VAASGGSRRAWGWHPLADEWARRIVEDAGVRPGQLVLDIGAGRGALTAHLVAAGAQVIAVEPHPGRARWLRERFAGARVTVVESDVLGLRLPHRPFRVVASPPYAISSALLRHLLAPRSRLVAADLVLQRAVVRRYTDGRDVPAARWEVRAGRSLPRRAFRPPPRVDSAVLVVRRRDRVRRG
jgi:23S rRNA (adenine-N6)-dimethyltransferase